ncbi:hypothetical protein ACET94_16765 [Aeromonas veronii]
MFDKNKFFSLLCECLEMKGVELYKGDLNGKIRERKGAFLMVIHGKSNILSHNDDPVSYRLEACAYPSKKVVYINAEFVGRQLSVMVHGKGFAAAKEGLERLGLKYLKSTWKVIFE